jgi:osmotically inducible lipoprotein OsmB
MKKLATIMILVMLGSSLVACSGMTQRERNTAIGTGVGAVAGTAISGGSAGGAIAGGVVGGVAGYNWR